MEEQSKQISLRWLRPPKVPLRPLNTESVEFLELRDSIRDHGLINPITVRPIEASPGYFEIVVGLHRFTACSMLGHRAMACIVKPMSDAEVLATQIAENAVCVPTKPVEYAKHLKRLQKAYPNLTVAQLGKVVGKSGVWVSHQLQLINLIEPAQLAADRGEMSVTNAYMLSKIPRNYQRGFLLQAKTYTQRDFQKIASEFIRDVMENRRTGQLHKHFLKDFEAQPYLRSLKAILNELATDTEGAKQTTKHITGSRSNRSLGAQRKAALQGWRLALQWVMHMDTDSIEKQKRASIEKQQKQEIERELYVNELDSEVPDEDIIDSDTTDSDPTDPQL